MMKEYEQSLRRADPPGLGHDGDLTAGRAGHPPPEVTGEDHWTLRGTAGRVMCGVEVRLVDDDGLRAAQRR